MNRRVIIWLTGLIATAFIVTSGASVIDLTGSDTAPGSGTTFPNCAGPLTISTPVDQGSGNRVTHVIVLGNMLNCAGHTMKVTLVIDKVGEYFAIYQFPQGMSQVSLTLNNQTGDFRDQIPLAANGTLVPQGNRVGPIKLKDLTSTDVVIALTWV